MSGARRSEVDRQARTVDAVMCGEAAADLGQETNRHGSQPDGELRRTPRMRCTNPGNHAGTNIEKGIRIISSPTAPSFDSIHGQLVSKLAASRSNFCLSTPSLLSANSVDAFAIDLLFISAHELFVRGALIEARASGAPCEIMGRLCPARAHRHCLARTWRSLGVRVELCGRVRLMALSQRPARLRLHGGCECFVLPV